MRSSCLHVTKIGWIRHIPDGSLGEDELPIEDQYTYRGVKIFKDCPWDTHISEVIENGKSQVGKIDAILTDPRVNTRFAICILILMDVIVSKLEHAREV